MPKNQQKSPYFKDNFRSSYLIIGTNFSEARVRGIPPQTPSMRESHLGFSCIRMQRRKSAFHSQPLSARAVSVHDSGGIAPVSSCARL